MRIRWAGAVLLGVVMLNACGAPRGAARLAAREEVALAAAEDDAAVREALVRQADAWESLAGQLRRRELFGVPVKADFTALAEQAGALAQRQRALIEAGEDDAASNRRALGAMRKMWGDVRIYLGE
jgi:hypothetical protein